jgi:hypothetical protein
MLNAILLLTRERSFGTGTYAMRSIPF